MAEFFRENGRGLVQKSLQENKKKEEAEEEVVTEEGKQKKKSNKEREGSNRKGGAFHAPVSISGGKEQPRRGFSSSSQDKKQEAEGKTKQEDEGAVFFGGCEQHIQAKHSPRDGPFFPLFSPGGGGNTVQRTTMPKYISGSLLSPLPHPLPHPSSASTREQERRWMDRRLSKLVPLDKFLNGTSNILCPFS